MKKEVFILYTADTHLNFDSYNVIGVFDSKAKLIKAITPALKEVCINEYKETNYENARQMFDDLLNNLTNINQTQSLTENYVIEKHILNEIKH